MNCEPTVGEIAGRVRRGERLSPDEAVVLYHHAPLSLLASLARGIKERLSGDAVYYNRNFHLEPTNICVFSCRFCSYRRGAADPGAWDCSLDEAERIARSHAGDGVTEVHIVGGVHPEHDIHWYAELIRRVKAAVPGAAVKAYTAVELGYMIRKAGMTLRDGLALLREAGMEAIPGGGAEIFDEGLRSRICPEKGTAAEWLALHEEAHRMGLRSNATMLYGHAETPAQRIDHLDRLRRLQDRTGGFDAFIPLKYRARHNSMEALGEVSVTEDMRTLALSRLYLDNFPHVKAYWVMYGRDTAETALLFGADDIDGTIGNTTKIYSMAGAEETAPSLGVEEIERMAASAGLRAVERDTFYNEIRNPL